MMSYLHDLTPTYLDNQMHIMKQPVNEDCEQIKLRSIIVQELP
jgi:hypothetical protein